jgi:type I restriction enzyme, S subunit
MYGATIGKVSIWKVDGSTNQACAVAQVNEALLYNEFLYYFLLSEKGRLIKAGKGGAQPNISQGIIKSWTIALPPLNEQHRIVAKIEELFSEIDKGVESLETAKAQLRVYRQSLLKHAFEGKLTAQWRLDNPDKVIPAEQLLEQIKQARDDRYQQQLKEWEEAIDLWEADGSDRKKPAKPKVIQDFFPIQDSELEGLLFLPNTWTYVRLSEVATIGSGMSVSENRKLDDPIEVSYLRVANVQRGQLILDEVRNMKIERYKLADLALKQWDILFNEGGDRDKLGRGWVWESQVSPCITQNHVFRATTHLESEYTAKLISHWGNSFGQKYFDTEGKQTTNLASINKTGQCEVF